MRKYLAALLLTATLAHAQNNYVIDPVATGLEVPVRFAFAPDSSGRIFYSGLFTGNIQVVLGDSIQNGVWLHVHSSAELKRGLLGIVFDPEFTANHFVYVLYITDADTPSTRVERYTEVNFRADTSSRLVLYDQTIATGCGVGHSHYGGALVFGVDGKLYISVGDNGCTTLAGQTTDPRGKILRIEPNIPTPFNAVATNPFYDDGDPGTGNDDRIFSKGLRNPFGMTLNRLDTTLYVTENGPDCNDEINRILSGRDYGWRFACASGANHCDCSQDSPYTRPIWRLRDSQIAPTGIIVYNGTTYPELYGKILFVDGVQGYIRDGTFREDYDTLDVEIISQPGFGQLYDIVQGSDGYIYFSHFDAIRRLRPLPAAVESPRSLVKDFTLSQSYPNPFNPVTRIDFEVSNSIVVSLKVFDILGCEVADLVHETKTPGVYSITWDASGHSSGMYYYRMQAGKFVEMKKLLLLK